MTDWGEVLTVVCTTIVILVIVGMFGFGVWTDYQIQKKHLEIEREKMQCMEILNRQKEEKQ